MLQLREDGSDGQGLQLAKDDQGPQREFKIYVTERKLVKAEQKLEELLEQRSKKIKVRDLSSVVGLLISFGQSMGRAARFHTRFSTIEVARVVDKQG